MTARTAYGLDTPRGEHWTAASACHGPDVDAEWWWPAEHGAPTSTTRLAVHVCRQHCPVLGRCGRWAKENPPKHPVVLGGDHYTAHGGRLHVAELVVSDARGDCPFCIGEASC